MGFYRKAEPGAKAASGTINSAKLAKDEILEKYPDADITIIYTKSAS